MRDRLPLTVKCSALTLWKRNLGLHCQAVKSPSLNTFLCNCQGLNRISEYTGTDERCVPKTTFHPHYTNCECKRTPFRPRLFQSDQNTENVKLIKIVGTHFWIQTFSAVTWDRIVWGLGFSNAWIKNPSQCSFFPPLCIVPDLYASQTPPGGSKNPQKNSLTSSCSTSPGTTIVMSWYYGILF